jgi:hypothetical protein
MPSCRRRISRLLDYSREPRSAHISQARATHRTGAHRAEKISLTGAGKITDSPAMFNGTAFLARSTVSHLIDKNGFRSNRLFTLWSSSRRMNRKYYFSLALL